MPHHPSAEREVSELPVLDHLRHLDLVVVLEVVLAVRPPQEGGGLVLRLRRVASCCGSSGAFGQESRLDKSSIIRLVRTGRASIFCAIQDRGRGRHHPDQAFIYPRRT